MKIIIIIILLTIVNFGFGQETAPDIVPVSPNAAALGEYGSIPVGYYTGIPNISIPIYEIELEGKKFPISFSYHASGIKVTQEASTVGLGWVLNAGGCITKEVRGYDDFQNSPTGYYWDTKLPAPDSNNDRDISVSYTTFKLYSESARDGEPDLFHYNFAGFSGSCFFKKVNSDGNSESSATATLRNGKDFIKIQYFIEGGANHVNDYWLATDLEGFKYYFHTNERTHSYVSTADVDREDYSYKPNQSYVYSASYIDSIVAPSGRKIAFSYEKDYIYTHPSYSEYCYKLLNIESECYSNEGGLVNTKQYSYPYSYSENEQALLTKITIPNGEISINYTDREDIESYTSDEARKIDNIIIKNNNDTIKKIDLKQSYMGSTSLSATQKRLMLDTLNINDGTYAFSYYKKEKGLPEKNIDHADYWGYYNNSDASSSTTFRLAPSVCLYYENEFHSFTGKDNAPKEAYMKIGTLTSIQYPTGGKSKFTYEMHDFSNTNTVGYKKALIEYYYVSNYDDPNDGDESEYNEFSDTFTVTSEMLNGHMEITYGCYKDCGETTISAIIYIQKETSSGFETIGDLVNLECEACESGGEQTYSSSFTFPSTGNYRIAAKIDTFIYEITPDRILYIIPNIDMTIRSMKANEINEGGGLRIKSITDYTNSDDYVKRTFSYKKDGVSTGLLMNKLNNIILFNDAAVTLVDGDGIFDLGGECSFSIFGMIASSSPWTPFTYSASGQSVGYSYVEEKIETTNGDNGKMSYLFANAVDKQIDVTDRLIKGYPSIPHLNNGNLLETTYYDSQDNIVKKENLTYTKVDHDSIKGLISFKPNIYANAGFVSLKYYDLFSERWLLTQKTDTLFYDNNCLTNTTKYQYDNSNWLVNNIKTYNSQNELIENMIKYPNDISFDIYNSMVTQHIISPVIEKTTKVNGNFTNSLLITYKEEDNNYVKDKIYKLEASTPLTSFTEFNGTSKDDNYSDNPEVEFVDYDDNGNPLKLKSKSGIYTHYVWAYNSQYPIAKIESSADVDISIEITDRELSGSDELSDIQNDVSYLKGKLSNYLDKDAYMVSYYTYKPLVGMTSQTAPTGVTTYYEYDDFGRLESIKDDDEHLLKMYEYNYAD